MNCTVTTFQRADPYTEASGVPRLYTSSQGGTTDEGQVMTNDFGECELTMRSKLFSRGQLDRMQAFGIGKLECLPHNLGDAEASGIIDGSRAAFR